MFVRGSEKLTIFYGYFFFYSEKIQKVHLCCLVSDGFSHTLLLLLLLFLLLMLLLVYCSANNVMQDEKSKICGDMQNKLSDHIVFENNVYHFTGWSYEANKLQSHNEGS